MDKTVEMVIIIAISILAALCVLTGQFNIVMIVVSGLIGFLSHGLIPDTSSTDSA
jgi:hypothetical protein